MHCELVSVSVMNVFIRSFHTDRKVNAEAISKDFLC